MSSTELVLSSGLVTSTVKGSPYKTGLKINFSPTLKRIFCSSSRSAEQSLFRNAQDLRIGCVQAFGGQSICPGGHQVGKGFYCSEMFRMTAEHPVCEKAGRGRLECMVSSEYFV